MESKFASEIQRLFNLIEYKSGAVDLNKVAEKLGIRVIEEDLPDNVSGVLDCRTKEEPIVLLNSHHHPNRRRFSLAHEIAHFVLHKMSGVHMDTKIFLRSDSPNLHGIKIEREANQFAAELLMPEEQIRVAWKNLPENWFDEKPLEIIAKQFKVSEGALFIRLKQLKGIGLVW
ncbi:MAG: ImmA/IrrE family metallo-endopeptidase [Leptospiraceae bacterium]|jgi:Zn-dependent peptidase ImmA (M78 family)|nr:ImmA/IrrE family metallo-endopeptidase [Leptospiraceae bacterium]MBK9501152.1 ImmA/IrrE family metallo-endopeptidase [Leptospiraceae bacterium]